MIKSMHLINIQSWRNEKIEFLEDVVNVISARSERGKTVLFKVFYQMVFPNYYKFGSRNDLIRRGSTYGEVTLELSNFTYILFHCEHKEQWFRMKRPCDEDWITYYQSNCPNEIINELGLVVDYELQYILNIYIKDNQYPFINTTKTWNAVLFNKVFKNDKLDKTIENMVTQLKELIELQKTLKTQINYKTMQNNQIVYKDIDDIKNTKDKLKKLNICYDIVDEIHKILDKYEVYLLQHEELKGKVFDVVDIMDIKELYLQISSIYNVTGDLEPHLYVIDNAEDYGETVLVVSSIRNCFKIVDKISKYSGKIESHLIDYSKSVNKYDEIVSIKEEVEKIKTLIIIVSNLMKSLSEMESKLIILADICKQIELISSELEEVKSKIKICPTCKRPL